MNNKNFSMDKIVNVCKTQGFVFQGSEIYGGFANTWDFGPVGVELKNNIKRAWWKRFVQEDPNAYGIDAAILMNPKGDYWHNPKEYVELDSLYTLYEIFKTLL